MNEMTPERAQELLDDLAAAKRAIPSGAVLSYLAPDEIERLVHTDAHRRMYMAAPALATAYLAEIARAEAAEARVRAAGWLYMDDDGNGPFWTDSERNAERYLSYWPVFRNAPEDGHICRYHNERGEANAYGICHDCYQLKRAAPAQTGGVE